MTTTLFVSENSPLSLSYFDTASGSRLEQQRMIGALDRAERRYGRDAVPGGEIGYRRESLVVDGADDQVCLPEFGTLQQGLRFGYRTARVEHSSRADTPLPFRSLSASRAPW